MDHPDRSPINRPEADMGMPVDDDDELLRLVAERLRILGDPTRLAILRALMAGELSVNEIGERCDRNQARVSKHLKLLTITGVLDRRKDGHRVFYRIADPAVAGLYGLVCESVAKTAGRAGRG